MSGSLLFWSSLFYVLIITFGQDFAKFSFGTESNLILPNGSTPHLIEKIDVFSTNEETGDVSEALKTLSYYQETAKGGRKKRQAVELDGDMSPVISNLHASQHCQGVFLRWERPQVPLSSSKPFTVSEFYYYNVYRSRTYFTSVNGMVPYASGKEIYELSKFLVSWLDKDPLTNEYVWYAVTIVTKKGKEWKDVSPVKAKFIGAFGPVGRRISLTSRNVRGRTLHHSAIYNPDRNEYFVVYDVDTNNDGQPDRVYALRMTPNGAIVRQQILDVTVTGTPGSQGWPSVAYNPVTNEYLIAVQVKSNTLFGGNALIAALRLWTTTFKLVTTPQLVLKGNENVNGKLVPLPVVNPYVIYSPHNSGYIVTAEFHSRSGSRNLALQFLDSTLKSIKAFIVFPYARSGRVAIDTKRNELYVIAQLARSAFSKGSTPKLAFAIAVKKTTLTGDVIPGGETLVKAGETELQDSSLSCFYDIARDRLMVFWSDVIAGKRVIRSSRILIQGSLGSTESLGIFKEETCPGRNLQGLSVVSLPTTTGQLVVGEERTRRGFRIHGSLIKDEAFQYVARNQRSPFLVSNERGDQVLALWQEMINERQSNVFGRILKATTHDCSGCSPPNVCKKQNTCSLPFRNQKPCSVSNGQCSQICLKSTDGDVKCSCRDGFRLGNDKITCNKQDNMIEDMTIIAASLKAIWKTRVMKDGSLQINRLFGGQSLVAVFIDEKTNLLYWSDVDASIIFRGHLDGTKREIFMSNVRSDGIYIDSVTGKVFWTDFLNKRIDVADTNMRNRLSLVTTEIDKPRAITSCKKHGVTYLYWSDWGSPSKIERLQLDGSLSLVANRRNIVSTQLVWPNGLTADCDENRLYWADAQLGKIEVSDLLGNRRQQLKSIKVFHPFSVLIYRNSIYWSDWVGAVKKADKQTGLNEVELFSGILPRGIYIFKQQTSCKDPGVPINAYRKGDDFAMNKVVRFICKKGYKLIGKSSIRCQNDGTWSDKAPACQSTICPDPPKPLNGNRNLRSNKIGGAVIYTCNPGYILIGEKLRRCIDGGVWSGSQPICMSLPVFAEIPQNKTIIHGKTAFFQCLATGAGKITLKWYKDGHLLQPSDATGRVVILGARLFLTKVYYSDAGKYSCQASNDAGMVRADAYLRVVTARRRGCGVPKFVTRQRIFNGRNAGEGAHPWMAMFWDKSKRRPFCGGSLIAPKFILTAAHCLKGFSKDFSNIQIKCGKIRAKRKAEPNEQVRTIKKIFFHPQYNSNTYDSDIAIVELSSPVDITDYVIPICLPHDESDFKLATPGANAVVIGWGATKRNKNKWSKRLKEVRVPIIDKAKCRKRMTYPVTDNMFCAGIGGHADACHGDSGGPITMKNPVTKKHILLGIVSWGVDCGDPNHYGIYVKLSNFLSWVQLIVS